MGYSPEIIKPNGKITRKEFFKRIGTAVTVGLICVGCRERLEPTIEPTPTRAATATPIQDISPTPTLSIEESEKIIAQLYRSKFPHFEAGLLRRTEAIEVVVEGDLYRRVLLNFHSERKINVNRQSALDIFNFFLKWKREPTHFHPLSLMVITDKDSPEPDKWGVTRKDEKGSVSVVSLGKIEKEPFDPRFELSIRTNVVFIAEMCNLLLHERDLAEGVKLDEICDSAGIMAGCAIKGFSYKEYREFLEAYQSSDNDFHIFDFLLKTYQAMKKILEGKPPLWIE